VTVTVVISIAEGNCWKALSVVDKDE
jgi:hypothetical protein